MTMDNNDKHEILYRGVPDGTVFRGDIFRHPVLCLLIIAFSVACLIGPVTAFTFTPSHPRAGEQIWFYESRGADDYEWTFGDGSTGTGNGIYHTYRNPGTFTVEMKGYYDNGEFWFTDSKTVVVIGADFSTSNSRPKVNEWITFDASRTYDPNRLIDRYEWNFGDNGRGSGRTISHQYSNPDSYTVTLTIYSKDRFYGSVSHEISVQPSRPPRAEFTYSPASPEEGETVVFDASGSEDPDGQIVSYSWDFGDGRSGSGMVVQHAYSPSGSRTVTLTVYDSDQNSDSRAEQIAVGPAILPVARIQTDTTNPKQGQAVTFDASGTQDPKGMINRYEWDFGDGTTGNGRYVTHRFPHEGTFTVTLTARSAELSRYSDTSSTRIFVRPYEPPIADFVYSPDRPHEGEMVLFDASPSRAIDGSIVSYRWDFGDGTTASGIRVRHSFQTAKPFPVRLTVIDSHDLTRSKMKTVTITYDVLPLAVGGTLALGVGTVSYSKYRKLCRRRACPKIPVSVRWSGGVSMKEPSADHLSIGVRFDGGIRDRKEV